MSKAIIELYVYVEDLAKQLDIIFDNGYEKITVSRRKDCIVEDGCGMAHFETKYFVRATIGADNESDIGV